MSFPVKVIPVCGILGHAQAKQFKRDVLNLVAAGSIEILVDFEQATFMDSAGLGALVSSLKAVKAAQGTLSLCAIRQEIRMLLELADVIQFFPIFADEAAFYQEKESRSAA